MPSALVNNRKKQTRPLIGRSNSRMRCLPHTFSIVRSQTLDLRRPLHSDAVKTFWVFDGMPHFVTKDYFQDLPKRADSIDHTGSIRLRDFLAGPFSSSCEPAWNCARSGRFRTVPFGLAEGTGYHAASKQEREGFVGPVLLQ
jgi:hypothetical protein